MSQKDQGKQINNIQEFNKCSILSKKNYQIHQKQERRRKKSGCIHHRCIVLIITAGWVMMHETLWMSSWLCSTRRLIE